MASETWLLKVKQVVARRRFHSGSLSSIPLHNHVPKSSTTFPTRRLGVLAFEVSGLMSKLFHLWQSLSDKNISHLRHVSISLTGVRKIVSNDDSFILGIACAEMVEALRRISLTISRLAQRCAVAKYRNFHGRFMELVESGRDPEKWIISWNKMEASNKLMDKYVSLTCALYKEMVELKAARMQFNDGKAELVDAHERVGLLKRKSLWSKSYDMVVSMLVKSVFTVMARIKLVFQVGHAGFWAANFRLLHPPDTTLGAAGLAFHYANVILALEKMIRAPQLVGLQERDDLYSMLPASLQLSLKCRLRSVRFASSEPELAGEWKMAVGRLLGWLSPLAKNMMKWQSARSFERRGNLAACGVGGENVMVWQTLVFANREKAEAAITELLVGLNYIWRYEREMAAMASEEEE